MPSRGRWANQRRIKSARYPTTITNLVIPASRHEFITCSTSGMSRRDTRGLGTPLDTDAIRLPLPAARISHSLPLVLGPLNHTAHFARKLFFPQTGPPAFDPSPLL